MWTLNSTTGKYSGDSGIYSFTINEDGAVVDNDPSFAVSSRFAF
jgi:hypothetical protein